MSTLINKFEYSEKRYSDCDLDPVSKWSPKKLDSVLKYLEEKEIISEKDFELTISIENEISNRKERISIILSEKNNVEEKGVSLVNFMEQLHEESLRLEEIIAKKEGEWSKLEQNSPNEIEIVIELSFVKEKLRTVFLELDKARDEYQENSEKCENIISKKIAEFKNTLLTTNSKILNGKINLIYCYHLLCKLYQKIEIFYCKVIFLFSKKLLLLLIK